MILDKQSEESKSANEQNTKKQTILHFLEKDLKALKNGTLKTRPARDFIAELKAEGYF